MGPRERPASLFLTSTKAAAGVVTEGSARLPPLVCRAQVERKVDTKGGFLRTGGLGGTEAPPGFPAVSAWVLSTPCVSCAPAGLCGSLACPCVPLGAGHQGPRTGPRAVAGGPAPPWLLKRLSCARRAPHGRFLGICSGAPPCRFPVSERPVSVCRWRRSHPGTPRKLPPRASAEKATAFTTALGQLLGGSLVALFPVGSATTS